MTRVVVLTEDGAGTARAWPVLLARFAAGNAVEVETPLRLWGARWKSTSRSGEGARREHLRLIQRKLAEGAIVVFHVDADTRWAEVASSDNADKYRRLIRDALDRVGVALGRLVLMLPCPSIESWLYLNDAALERLVEQDFRLDDAVRRVRALRGPLGFDDRSSLKDAVPDLADRYDPELASDYPVRRSRGVSPSLAASLDRWDAAVGPFSRE